MLTLLVTAFRLIFSFGKISTFDKYKLMIIKAMSSHSKDAFKNKES